MHPRVDLARAAGGFSQRSGEFNGLMFAGSPGISEGKSRLSTG